MTAQKPDKHSTQPLGFKHDSYEDCVPVADAHIMSEPFKQHLRALANALRDAQHTQPVHVSGSDKLQQVQIVKRLRRMNSIEHYASVHSASAAGLGVGTSLLWLTAVGHGGAGVSAGAALGLMGVVGGWVLQRWKLERALHASPEDISLLLHAAAPLKHSAHCSEVLQQLVSLLTNTTVLRSFVRHVTPLVENVALHMEHDLQRQQQHKHNTQLMRDLLS